MNKNSKARKAKEKIERRAADENGELVISQNHRRNMEQRVVQWKDPESGKRVSKTIHCKINPNREARPKPRRSAEYIPQVPVPSDAVEKES